MESKSMKALKTGEGVQIGVVVVKNTKGKKLMEKPIVLQKIGCSIIDKNNAFLGSIGICKYDDREVYQCMPKSKMEELGLIANFLLTPIIAEKVKAGQGGTGIGMTLLSYVILEDEERGNKLLREYDYISNQNMGVDVMTVTYQNSSIGINWICEVCGRRFEALLNNRVAHSKSDCKCHRIFYQTSINEELVALMLKKSIPNLKRQERVFGDRRRVDMSFEMGGQKYIVEYDGNFHKTHKDYERDLEAKSLGYTTIRIQEIGMKSIHYDRINFIYDDVGPYIPQIDRHTVFCNYFAHRDSNEQTLNIMFENLQKVLKANGIIVNIEPVTIEMLKEAEGNRLFRRKIIEVY